MTKTIIKIADGTIVEINGSSEETQRILSLYLNKDTFNNAEIIKEGQIENVAKIQEDSPQIQTALDWAKSQIGKYVQPCTTSDCKYNQVKAGTTACRIPNPSADADDIEMENEEDYHPFWNFYCMRFVRTAYKAPPEYPKAHSMYEALNSANAISKNENIPVGALVFWFWSSYGHIGIYTGNGKVIHTGVNPSLKKKGVRESPLVDITEVLDRYNHYQIPQTSYLGWAYPPKNWVLN